LEILARAAKIAMANKSIQVSLASDEKSRKLVQPDFVKPARRHDAAVRDLVHVGHDVGTAWRLRLDFG
jgi:hypothetical protein